MSNDRLDYVIAAHSRSDVVVVALDGYSGSGKSTLAQRTAAAHGGIVVVGDDFYRVMRDTDRWALAPADGVALYFDWQRLRDEALAPLRAGDVAAFRPYNWAAGRGLHPAPVTIGPATLVVVDGAYSARPELAQFADLAVLVDTPEDVRAVRLAERGHGNDAWHSRWNAAETHYFRQIRPPASFNLVVPGY